MREGGGGGLRGLSQCVQLYTGAKINFGDLTPYLTQWRKLTGNGDLNFLKDGGFKNVNKEHYPFPVGVYRRLFSLDTSFRAGIE